MDDDIIKRMFSCLDNELCIIMLWMDWRWYAYDASIL